jgi:glucose-6-phosphate dehydrogenase assembly protein OpcA
MKDTIVKPETVARDLQELWTQLAQDQAETGGVLKACAMTLVVLAQDEADANDVQETLGSLMHDHPARAIVVWQDPTLHEAGTPYDARVFAKCWQPLGKNQQICAEGIEILAGTARVEEIARFIVPLRVPDLPLVLWCRGPMDQTYMYRKRYAPLYELADKIIFDTQQVLDAEAGIEFLRAMVDSGHRIADLHWTRLTGYREALAHLVDDGAIVPSEVTAARIGYSGSSVSTCALYCAAWIRVCLPGIRVAVEPEKGPPGVSSVTLKSPARELALSLDGECVCVEGPNRSYRAALPPTTEDALMRQELKILGRDPVWDKVLAA